MSLEAHEIRKPRIALVDDQEQSATSLAAAFAAIVATSAMSTLGDIFEFVPVPVDPNPRGLQERAIQAVANAGPVDTILVDLSFDINNAPAGVEVGRRLAHALRAHFEPFGVLVGVYTKHRLRLRQRALIAQDGFAFYLEELRMMLDGPEQLQGDDWLQLFEVPRKGPQAANETTKRNAFPKRVGKPRLFVGCSVESLPIAEALQENLDYDLLVILWTQAEFILSQDTLSSLLRQIDSFDFSVFILAPNDVLRMRGHQVHAARDNVVFELGLFIGRNGREKTFLLTPRGEELHLPTDLAGITPITYDGSVGLTVDVIRGVVGAACTKLKRAILDIA
jgi:predicted nucleotide-binding protein